jgi:hypothetical protein
MGAAAIQGPKQLAVGIVIIMNIYVNGGWDAQAVQGIINSQGKEKLRMKLNHEAAAGVQCAPSLIGCGGATRPRISR